MYDSFTKILYFTLSRQERKAKEIQLELCILAPLCAIAFLSYTPNEGAVKKTKSQSVIFGCMTPVIEKRTFDFLKALARNNDRDWFNAHKADYVHAQENVVRFLDALIDKMNMHDRLETRTGKKSLYRIYNDVRFSDDKTPYNPRFAGHLSRMKPQLRGGYYFWIKPGESRVGCGFSYPNAEDLLRIRQDIDVNHADWRKLLKSKSIQRVFGEMQGDHVKTAPRGFAKDHPAIDLLRHKQYWFEHSFTDKEVLASDFLKHIDKTYQSIRPFFDYMSDVLTSDLNGLSKL